MEQRYLSQDMLQNYRLYLQGEERAEKTIQKYVRDIASFLTFCGPEPVTKETVVQFKGWLLCSHNAASVNSMLAAVNGFLAFLGWHECRVRAIRIQRSAYRDTARQLTRQEYYRLVQTAQRRGQERLALLLQTICSTGIRVSELHGITVAAAHAGRAEMENKGKTRTVFLPRKLCAQLLRYCARHGIHAGEIFITRSGRPLDRSNIWSMMKALARSAGVAAEKVFPHNLRHLFAVCFYQARKDLDHLAAILGHSSINTTRIYTQTDGEKHRRELEALQLVLL